MYSFKQSADKLNVTAWQIKEKCKQLGLKLHKPKKSHEYISDIQLSILEQHFLSQVPTGNRIEIIKVTQTFYIYESSMNYPD